MHTFGYWQMCRSSHVYVCLLRYHAKLIVDAPKKQGRAVLYNAVEYMWKIPLARLPSEPRAEPSVMHYFTFTATVIFLKWHFQ